MRFQPKQWARPRGRRWREEQAAEALGVEVYQFRAAEILKDIYHCGYRRPSWARLARARGWMTDVEYYELEATERDPSGDVTRLLYEESPFFKMLSKSAPWEVTS